LHQVLSGEEVTWTRGFLSCIDFRAHIFHLLYSISSDQHLVVVDRTLDISHGHELWSSSLGDLGASEPGVGPANCLLGLVFPSGAWR
jgi:hypothetical protein